MSRRKTNSRVLRQLAEELFERIAGDGKFPKSERSDFVTSLVRQWITYDGNATFFLGDRQVYFVLGQTPLGKPVVVPVPGLTGWTKRLIEDWKINPDNLPDIIHQLNLGQSAETASGDGLPLRLWVNPKQRSRGVEPLAKEKNREKVARDYRKFATRSLEALGDELGQDELDELACSVVSQWQRFDGHASLFIGGHTEFRVQITNWGDGGCRVLTNQRRFNLNAALSDCGFTPDLFPEIIARINLGQQIEFRDRQGVRSRLWYDPKAQRVCCQPLDPAPPLVGPPMLCPKCTAALLSRRQGERQHSCPICGYTVSLQ